MNSQGQGHVEIYRVAFDVAQRELGEITAEFEKLRVRKEHVERLVIALKPIIGEAEIPKPTTLQEEPAKQGDAIAPAVEAPSEEVAQPLGVGADPFQRRVDHVLGIGGGIRDVRQYTRQF